MVSFYVGITLLITVLGFIIKGLRKENVQLEGELKVTKKELKQTLNALRELERTYDEVIKELPTDVDALNNLVNRLSRDED